MNWLICGVGSFVVATCVLYMFFDSKKKNKNFWCGIYLILFVMNFLEGIFDFIIRTDHSKATVIMQIVCAFIMIVLVLLSILVNYKTKQIDGEIARLCKLRKINAIRDSLKNIYDKFEDVSNSFDDAIENADYQLIVDSVKKDFDNVLDNFFEVKRSFEDLDI